MKVKAVYNTLNMPEHFVLETLDGQKMMARRSPYRTITEADLSPAPGYQLTGKNAEPMPEYIYRFYGLEPEPRIGPVSHD